MRIGFITLTNNGYIDYTLNCLQSLKNINSPALPICCCVGKEGTDILQSHGYQTELLHDSQDITGFEKFEGRTWGTIMYKKLEIIYEHLKKNDWVLYTDGDIVFERPGMIEYLVQNAGDYELLIQNDQMTDDNIDTLCAGFMFIKSTPNTLALFDPSVHANVKHLPGWNDQLYINHIKFKLRFKMLPLDLFPNGQYYYTNYERLQPFMIHFNWIIGHEKRSRMQKHGKWFLPTSTLMP